MPNAPLKFPKLIHHHRWCDNGDYPDAFFPELVATGLNHAMAYRRKMIAVGYMPLAVAAASASVQNWAFRFKTGHGATQLRVQLLIGQDLAGAGTNPRVDVSVTPSGGGATVKTAYYGLNGTSADDAPWSLSETTLRFDASAATTYTVVITGQDRARPVSFCAYEFANPVIDQSVNYYCELAPTVEYPVYDADRARLLLAASELWLENAAPLLIWPGIGDGSAQSVTGTTWTNIIDETSTTVTANTPGFYFWSAGAGATALSTLLPMVRLSGNNDLPVRLDVLAAASGGGTGSVRIVDSTGAGVSIGGIGGLAWSGIDTTLNNVDAITLNGKLDIQASGSTAGTTCSVYAVCLYPRR